jgi:uncharacterized protein
MPHIMYSAYLKKRHGERVHRISIDAGFTCPNRDGSISALGCIYCDNKSFSYNSNWAVYPQVVLFRDVLPLDQQIDLGIEYAQKRFRAKKYMLYLQAYTNTYGPIEKLKSVYDIAKQCEDIVGISIATRPDCVNKEILDLIQTYTEKYDVWIEYGIQSIHNDTLKFINRGHTYETFLNTFYETKKRNIKVCGHVILGLPNETRDMMMQTAKEMSKIKIDSIKIHPLYVAKNTILEQMYNEKKYEPLNFYEYKDILNEFLKNLSEDIIIDRLNSFCPKDLLVAPDWVSEDKKIFL